MNASSVAVGWDRGGVVQGNDAARAALGVVMIGLTRIPRFGIAAGFAAACLLASNASAASKAVDLDLQSANGAESSCALNVLQTFPVKIENVVTNKAIGDAFNFSWPSAGPGGFTSSATAGTSGGVGAKWTWTTNQTVYSYTGSSCDTDVCFSLTSGSDQVAGTCSLACLDDGVTILMSKGSTAGEVDVTWSAGSSPFTVYRSTSPSAVDAPANELGSTTNQIYTDVPPAGTTYYYKVRASTCLTPKSCVTDSDCNPLNEGVCNTRGPFGVPGRSLTSNAVTVSSASLTSSLITFFSPPTEVFRATSTAQPGGTLETLTNSSTQPVTSVTPAYPPGCCPADPSHPHQLNCGGTCVDYLTDPDNCGACGNVCGDGTCCVNGNCASLCPAGQVWCNGACIDPANDSNNCGACGNICGDGTCCNEGACVSLCPAGQVWHEGLCYDVQNDSNNCGTVGNVCGAGTCCYNGTCAGECQAGWAFCNGLCYDIQDDPNNCGGCGITCDDQSVCTGGACVPCSGHGGAKYACDNVCTNLNTDPYNCGACGNNCNLGCPSDFHGVCSNGNSCSCVAGTPAPPPPSNVPEPEDPMCPNPNPSSGPTSGVCPNPNPSSPIDGVCPNPGPPPPQVVEAPVCEVEQSTTTIPPGGSSTTCISGGVLFREVPSAITVCGDGLPGPDGQCLDAVSHVSHGTFMRLLPDTSIQVGDAYVTPYAVHVTADTSNDGLLQPGETASLVIDVLNAGPTDITGATATLTAPSVDLTQDGVDNPVGIDVTSATSSYGTISGTPATTDCTPVTLHPASNATPFQITVPPDHPGDTGHPFTLEVTGTVSGAPFTMSVPLDLGIAGACSYAAHTGDYDGLDGLLSPMAKLVPVGDTVPFPSKPFNAGNTRPLKLTMSCGGTLLTDADVVAPQIVGLTRDGESLDIGDLNLNDDNGANPNDPFFRYNASNSQWIFNMRTALIGTGSFQLTIRIAGRKDYVTGFVLQ